MRFATFRSHAFAIAAAFLLMARAVDHAVMAVVGFLVGLAPRLSIPRVEAPAGLALSAPGHSFDASLLQSLRHEARVHKFGAARNI